MEIVITNDDGWGTAGIRTLVAEMSKLGHVTVVAPDSARSGHATCISVGKPIYIHRLDEECTPEVEVYTCSGTPADCVKMLIEVLFRDKPIDLLVSGINHGNNCSVNLMYSGTMGACFVATEHKIPAIGFSLDDHSLEADFSLFRPYLTQIVGLLRQRGFVDNRCYNVNAPTGAIRGIRWTRQCEGHWEKELETYTDAEGHTYYMLAGEFINYEPQDETTDMWAIEHGFISIQPVSIDMTDFAALGKSPCSQA